MFQVLTGVDLIIKGIGVSMTSNVVSGPAIMTQYLNYYSSSCDYVYSLWCHEWPKEAKDWLKRCRYHGWPTIDTISDVVRHGCHVVYVQHRDCRTDKAQWRLSFSLAEVILLQSWTKIQQIVYHLLRYFAKRELIQKECPKEEQILCTYHLKTLMLWTCEEMSPEWWISSSIITICCDLLKRLSEWLKRGYFPNYFIPEANLFHESSNYALLDKTERRLNEFVRSGFICDWFVKNYIMSFARTFFGIETTAAVTPHILDFEIYKLALFEYRKANESKSIDFLLSIGFMHFSFHVYCLSKSPAGMHWRSISIYMFFHRNLDLLSERMMSLFPISENVWSLKYFDKTLLSLKAVHGLGCGTISWDSDFFPEYAKEISLNFKIVRCQYHTFPKPYTAERSHFQYLQAEELMESLIMSKFHSDFKLLSLLSKELLRKALQCCDSQSDSIAPAALVYLAALHFATSESRIVIALCSKILMDQITHVDNEAMNAGCLFFIDDVSRIVGSYLLCRKFKRNMHHKEKQVYLDLRLTPKISAHYLTVILAGRISQQLELKPALTTSAFPFDKCLLILTKRKVCTLMNSSTCFNVSRHCVYLRTNSLTLDFIYDVNRFRIKEEIIDALMKHALENMNSLYNVIHNQCNSVDCYRALHFYKCSQYSDALYLCERILQEPDLHCKSNEMAFSYVSLLPPFDSFFDEDIQSLLGLHTLLCNLSYVKENMLDVDFTPKSLPDLLFGRFLYCRRDEPSNTLTYSFPIKRLYFLGRHFLARYLKLRCYTDHYHSHTEALADFAVMKIRLPFELIIRRVILRKLR